MTFEETEARSSDASRPVSMTTEPPFCWMRDWHRAFIVERSDSDSVDSISVILKIMLRGSSSRAYGRCARFSAKKT